MGGGRERRRKGISKGGRERGGLLQREVGRKGGDREWKEGRGEGGRERRRLLQREGGEEGRVLQG